MLGLAPVSVSGTSQVSYMAMICLSRAYIIARHSIVCHRNLSLLIENAFALDS